MECDCRWETLNKNKIYQKEYGKPRGPELGSLEAQRWVPTELPKEENSKLLSTSEVSHGSARAGGKAVSSEPRSSSPGSFLWLPPALSPQNPLM